MRAHTELKRANLSGVQKRSASKRTGDPALPQELPKLTDVYFQLCSFAYYLVFLFSDTNGLSVLGAEICIYNLNDYKQDDCAEFTLSVTLYHESPATKIFFFCQIIE